MRRWIPPRSPGLVRLRLARNFILSHTMAAVFLVVSVIATTTMARGSASSAFATRSAWKDIPMGADDPILGLNQAFAADPSPEKVSLGVGAYRDSDGKPMVLRAVRAAASGPASRRASRRSASRPTAGTQPSPRPRARESV